MKRERKKPTVPGKPEKDFVMLYKGLAEKLGKVEDKICNGTLRLTRRLCWMQGRNLVQGKVYPVIDGVEFVAGCDCEILLNWPWYTDNPGLYVKAHAKDLKGRETECLCATCRAGRQTH